MGRKVLVLTSTFPRWAKDSTSVFVYELSRRLAEYGNNILVLAPHHHGAEHTQRMGQLTIIRFRYFVPERLQKLAYGAGIIPNMKSSWLAKLQAPFFLITGLIAAGNAARHFKPELIHAHWIIPQGLAAAVLKKMLGIPFIATVHGSDLFPITNPLLKSLQHFVLKNCDICTVNSKATEKEIMKRFPDAGKKILTIPMGVDVREFSSKKRKKKKGFTVLFVGRLNEQKGIKYLIAAMSIVKLSHPKARLVVIGEGDYMEEMKDLAKSLKISGSVEFLGGLPHGEVINHYIAADLFVLPSVESKMGTEGLGLSILEAMAAKVPVIGTSTGGIKYIIKDGHNGILARQKDPEDLARCITKLLADRKLRAKCTANAFKFVRENYTWVSVARKFQKLYGGVK